MYLLNSPIRLLFLGSLQYRMRGSISIYLTADIEKKIMIRTIATYPSINYISMLMLLHLISILELDYWNCSQKLIRPLYVESSFSYHSTEMIQKDLLMKQVIFCHFNLVMNILYNHLYRTEAQNKHLVDAIPTHIWKKLTYFKINNLLTTL